MRIKIALLCVALASSAVPASAAPKVVIDIKQYAFSQPAITVQLGQPIEWRNLEDAPVPIDPTHNIVEDVFIPPGGAPVVTTKRICARFEPGQSCQPRAADLPTLLPRGRHFLTCTIDSDHTLLMHMVVEVV